MEEDQDIYSIIIRYTNKVFRFNITEELATKFGLEVDDEINFRVIEVLREGISQGKSNFFASRLRINKYGQFGAVTIPKDMRTAFKAEDGDVWNITEIVKNE